MQHRLRQTEPTVDAFPLFCPSYEALRIQFAILGYVVGEGHHDETVAGLLRRYSLANGGAEDDAVKRSFLDLIARAMLCIDGGKVVPFRMEFAAQSAVLVRVVYDAHDDETIFELSRRFSQSSGSSVELAIRELVGGRLLCLDHGRVVPDRAPSG